MDNELLRSIERKLDAGDLNSAQKLLATADPFYTHGQAVSYLTTRLLYLRSRITEQEAAQRLRDLRSKVDHFPELERWLEELEPTPEPSDAPPDELTPSLPLPAIETVSSPGHKIPLPPAATSAGSADTLERRSESDAAYEPSGLELDSIRPLKSIRPTLDVNNLGLVSFDGDRAPDSATTAPVTIARVSLTSRPPPSDAKRSKVEAPSPVEPRPEPVTLKPAESVVAPSGEPRPEPTTLRPAVSVVDARSEPITLKPVESVAAPSVELRRSEPVTLKPVESVVAPSVEPRRSEPVTLKPVAVEPRRSEPATKPPEPTRISESPAFRPSDPISLGRSSSQAPRTRPRPSIKPSLPASMRLSTDADGLLVSGNADEALRSIEEHAQVHVALRTGGTAETNPATLAQLAAKFFTTAPVMRDFAPYDLSLWSVPRLDAALDLLLGDAPLESMPEVSHPLLRLLGSYVGETLRYTHEGTWEGDFTDPEQARVVIGEHVLHPFELVTTRWKRGAAARIRNSITAVLKNRNNPPWQRSLPCSIDPPMPWQGQQDWPEIGQMPELSIGLSHSVVALYCQSSCGFRLDGSVASVAALDSYLNLIAPNPVESAHSIGWARRVATWLGAYVGQALCAAKTGTWRLEPSNDGASTQRLAVVLENQRAVYPVEAVFTRLESGTKERLSEYARDLTK